MTTAEVATMIASIGLPYAYYEFPDDTERTLPFVCFLYTENNDLSADNTTYTDIRTLVVELYTRQRDFALEATVRSVLNANELPFRTASEYLDDEGCFVTTFTTEVAING